MGISAKAKGSAPISGNNKSHISISDEEESILDDNCNYSGSSSESSEERK